MSVVKIFQNEDKCLAKWNKFSLQNKFLCMQNFNSDGS